MSSEERAPKRHRAGTPLGCKAVSLLGAPFSFGQPKPGVEDGVAMMRDAGLVKEIEKLGYQVYDKGDLAFEELQDDEPAFNVKRPRTVGRACEKISKAVAAAAQHDDIVLTVGGDHSLAAGTIHGHTQARPNLCVVWVDAHGDINNSDTSPSGNLHGMPVAMLMGLEKQALPGWEWSTPCLKPSDIVYVGLRDVDEGERALLKEYNIKAFSMTHVDKYGIGKLMDMALDHVNPNRDRPIHLSFDVDAFDPSVAPSTGTDVRGGLTFREGHYLCEAIAETGLLRGLDIVEVNPAIGTKEEVQATVDVGVSLCRSALGETLL